MRLFPAPLIKVRISTGCTDLCASLWTASPVSTGDRSQLLKGHKKMHPDSLPGRAERRERWNAHVQIARNEWRKASAIEIDRLAVEREIQPAHSIGNLLADHFDVLRRVCRRRANGTKTRVPRSTSKPR